MKQIKCLDLPLLFSILFLTFLDLLSKYYFCFKSSYLVCTLNTGSAWSLFSSVPNYSVIIGIIGIIISMLFVYFNKEIIKELHIVVFCLLLSGVMGNSINRVIYQGVFDMFSIPFLPLFGIFNLADVFISIAIVVFIFKEITKSKTYFHN